MIHHASNLLFHINIPEQMSSVIFGRGTHLQVGSMDRAEAVNRELTEIRQLRLEVEAIRDTARARKHACSGMHKPAVAPNTR